MGSPGRISAPVCWCNSTIEDRRTSAARTQFDRCSSSYEQGRDATRFQEIQGRALSMLELGPEDTLLDLGCGTGVAVREAAKVVRRAVGLDLSSGMIAQARDRSAGLANVEFVEGDTSAPLPFVAGAFTAALCTTAFHHFPRQRTVLGELGRVLALGGRVVTADANRRHPAVFVLDFILRVVQKSHVGFRGPAWFTHGLRTAGFSDLRVETAWGGAYVFVRARKGG
jgi:ubiquinone/menaquinone biosynthesis C-methylase UbiE